MSLKSGKNYTKSGKHPTRKRKGSKPNPNAPLIKNGLLFTKKQKP